MINFPIIPIILTDSQHPSILKDTIESTTTKRVVNSINAECVDPSIILVYTIIFILTLVFITIHNKINDTYRS